MARKGRGRKAPLAVINVNETITLGTVGSGIVVSAVTDTFTREFFAISCDIYWSMKAHTAGEGPYECGVAHGSYSVTQIQENLQLTGMEDPGDLVTKEQGQRKVRRSGRFNGLTTIEMLNDGKPIRTKLGFPVVGSGAALEFWIRSLDDVSATTGTSIDVQGKIYGRWM